MVGRSRYWDKINGGGVVLESPYQCRKFVTRCLTSAGGISATCPRVS